MPPGKSVDADRRGPPSAHSRRQYCAIAANPSNLAAYYFRLLRLGRLRDVAKASGWRNPSRAGGTDAAGWSAENFIACQAVTPGLRGSPDFRSQSVRRDWTLYAPY